MKSNKKGFKKRYILLSTVIMAFLVAIFVFFEIRETNKDLEKMLRNESLTLIETINLNIENSIATNNEIEDLLLKRLNAVAAFAAHLREDRNVSSSILGMICEEFDVSFLGFVAPDGEILSSNFAESNYFLDVEFLDELELISSGEYKWLELGIFDNPINNKEMYFLARGTNSSNYAVLAGYDVEELLEFRRKIGIGKQVQDIGKNKDVAYMVLQDFEGIWTATQGVQDITAIEADSFLLKSIDSDTALFRIKEYGEEYVFEIVKPIKFDDDFVLNRLALSLDNIENIQARSKQRAVIIGFVIFSLGAIAFGFVFTRERLSILKDEHQRMKSYTELILENIADGVIAFNQDKKITLFNQAAEQIFSIPKYEALDKSYEQIFINDKLLADNIFNGKNILKYYEVKVNSGKKSITLGITNSILQNEGSTQDIILTIKDLTAQKQIEEKLQRKEKFVAMGELAAGVAHEIRNPLNAINVIAQRLDYEFSPESDKEEYSKLVKVIRSEVVRVNNIIKQFLEFARPKRLNFEQVSLNQLIAKSISIVESQAEQKGIKIVVKYAGDFIATVDSEKLLQALLNLMQNAVEVSEAGEQVLIELHKKDSSFEINIIDNGGGVPEEFKSKIFNLYFTTKPTGSGIGLSIVHQIISEHNGELSFESESGKGTRFTILLPE